VRKEDSDYRTDISRASVGTRIVVLQGPERASDDRVGGWLEEANGSARPGIDCCLGKNEAIWQARYCEQGETKEERRSGYRSKHQCDPEVTSRLIPAKGVR
jgi:hypothetical protein